MILSALQRIKMALPRGERALPQVFVTSQFFYRRGEFRKPRAGFSGHANNFRRPFIMAGHLLARQVIGPASYVEDDGTEGFWKRNEHILLPMTVMGSALVLVAYVPFFFYAS